MSSPYAAIHASQDLIYALQNAEPDSQLVTIVNTHNDALINLASIFDKATYSSRPTRVVHTEQHQPIIENIPDKIKTPNHEEPLRVHIVETRPEELQHVHQVKNNTQ